MQKIIATSLLSLTLTFFGCTKAKPSGEPAAAAEVTNTPAAPDIARAAPDDHGDHTDVAPPAQPDIARVAPDTHAAPQPDIAKLPAVAPAKAVRPAGGKPDIARAPQDTTNADNDNDEVQAPASTTKGAPSSAPQPDIAPVAKCKGALLPNHNSCKANQFVGHSTDGNTWCFASAKDACNCQCGKPDCKIAETAPAQAMCN